MKSERGKACFSDLLRVGMPTHPLHFTHLKTHKKFFSSPGGGVAYECVGRMCVVAGPPMGSERVLQDFVSWGHQRELGICGYYFPESMKPPLGLNKYQIGVSRSLRLETFQGRGRQWRDLRRAMNQGRRGGWQAEELLDPFAFFEEMVELERVWREGARRWGRHRRIGFLLSSVSSFLSCERFFCVRKGRELAAFVSLLPYWERARTSYYIDTLIQSPQAPSLALDFLLSQLIWCLKGEGAYRLNFGLCPFQGMRTGSFIEWMLALQGKLDVFYNSKGLYLYKKKFTDVEKREYLLMDSQKPFLEQVRALYKVTWPSVCVGESQAFCDRVSSMDPQEWGKEKNTLKSACLKELRK